MGLFGLTGSKSKTKYSENQVQQNQIDPFFAQQGRDTLSAFDRLTSGVMGRYGMAPTFNQNSFAPSMTGGFDGISYQPEQTYAPLQAGGPESFVYGFGDTTTGAMNDITGWRGSGDQLRALAAGVMPDAITAGTLGAPQQVGQIAAPGTIGNISAAQIAPVTNAEASTARQYMDQYFNPYLKDVVDTSLADFDVGAARQSTEQRMRRDAGSAFGDRAAIADAVLGGELARGRGSLSANLRSNAFNTAAGLGAGDAGRFTSVSMANAGAANARAQAQAQLEMQSRLANSDIEGRNIENRFRSDVTNADIQSGNIDRQMRADQFNIDNKLTADQANIDNALRGTGISADLIKNADATDLLAIKNRLEVGMMQDENAQARLSEPLNLIMQKLALLSGLPYNTTTTTDTKGKRSGTSIGFDISAPLGK